MAFYSSTGVFKTFYKMPAYSAPYNPAKKEIEGGDKSEMGQLRRGWSSS
jgi:hypothetical protein